MSSITDFLIQIGSAVAVALWASARLLRAVLVPAIERTKNSGDLRYIIHRVVIVALVMLAVAVTVVCLAYKIVSADHNKPADGEERSLPAPHTTTSPAISDEYPGNPPTNSHQDAKPAPLQSPHARSGVTDQSNGS